MIVFIGTSLQLVSYNSSRIELLLNNVCLTNLYEESLTNLRLISPPRI
jgi:hypothetical protein